MLGYILKNWKTSALGIAVAVMIAVRDAYVTGTLHKSTIAITILTAIWGFVMKDTNVTGGTEVNSKTLPRTAPYGSETRRLD